MLRVVESSAAANRLAAAWEFIAEFPPGQEILVIGATREAVDDFVRQRTVNAAATFGLHRYTLLQLAARLTAECTAAEGLAPATTLATEALAARCTFEAAVSGALPYFAPVAGLPGFARTLTRTVSELRLTGLDVGQVAALGHSGRDLAELLARFNRALIASQTVDRADLLRMAAQLVGSAQSTLSIRQPIVFLDIEIASLAEADFVRTLVESAPSTLATVPTGDQRTSAALRALATASSDGAQSQRGASCETNSRTAQAEPAEASPHRKPTVHAPEGETSSLARLREYLFVDQAPTEADLDESVRFFSAPGEGREAIEIARYILDEARAGVPFDEIAVFLRMPETYSAALQTAFGRAGVPAYFARGTKRPDPAGRAFLALLGCAADGLSAKRFAEYLSFGETPFFRGDGPLQLTQPVWAGADDEMLGPSARAARQVEQVEQYGERETVSGDDQASAAAAPWRWEDLIVEASVIGSHARWVRRLDGLEKEIALKIAETSSDDPASPQRGYLERQLTEIGALKRFALPVIERLAALPHSGSWGDWLAALTGLAPVTLRRPERVLRVLAELEPMASVGPVAIDEVTNVLSERLSFLEEDPPAYRYGCVFVAPVQQARGRSFRIAFIPGLAERVFPQRPREDPLLLDAQRSALSPHLLTQTERGQHERLLLRLAVGAARARVYFSYPRADVVEARSRVTSFYGLDVFRASTGRIPDIDALERRAAGAANARLAWPAPSDPERAIDPVEHDLSTLYALFHEGHAEGRTGRARYLFDLNDHLSRSLRARYARWERSRWSEFDGMVRTAPGTAEALAAHRLGARAYSPSALEKYAVCPYRFLLAAIHRLEPRNEIVIAEHIDPLTRGRLLHQVQAETLRTLRDDGLLPLNQETLARAVAVLDTVLARVADAYRDELAPPILRVWQDEIDGLRVDLVAWLHHAAADRDWQPRYFELGFGLQRDPGRDPASTPDPVVVLGGARLRGSVDLVERAASRPALRVTDYKTGTDRTRPGMIVGNGETLQPVLYALAIEAALGIAVDEARLFFCTNRGGFAERVVPIDDAARAAGRRVLEIIDRSIESGVFPPAPRQDACVHCDFRLVCGPHEAERLRRKDQRLLRDLDALRSMP